MLLIMSYIVICSNAQNIYQQHNVATSETKPQVFQYELYLFLYKVWMSDGLKLNTRKISPQIPFSPLTGRWQVRALNEEPTHSGIIPGTLPSRKAKDKLSKLQYHCHMLFVAVPEMF